MSYNLFIGIALGLLPVLSWFIQYFYSIKNNKLKLFKNHPQTYLLDWLFIPFNILWVYTISLDIPLFFIFLGSSISINFFSDKFYKKMHIKENRNIHLFSLKTSKLNTAGYAHAIFSVAQLFLIFSFIFSRVSNIYVYANLIILALFLIPNIYFSKNVHGSIDKYDLALVLFGLLMIALKLFVF